MQRDADELQPRAPQWLQSLLYMAAERLAMSGGAKCDFRAHAGPAVEVTYVASLQFDPVSTTAAVYVHHKATGRFVCRSVPAVVDALDESHWNTDVHNELDATRGQATEGTHAA